MGESAENKLSMKSPQILGRFIPTGRDKCATVNQSRSKAVTDEVDRHEKVQLLRNNQTSSEEELYVCRNKVVWSIDGQASLF